PGLRALADLIATMNPDPNTLAAHLGWADETVALELLRLAKGLKGADSWPARKAALAHPSQQVQKQGLSGLDPDQLLAHRLELLPLLFSPNADLRREVFAPFIASKDKGVAPALATLLRRVPLEHSEHKRVLLALGSLGGPEASGALRQELKERKDVELQCT